MLAYAAGRPLVGKRQSSPHAMLLVIAMHVALIAGVMSARMNLPRRIPRSPIIVDLLPELPPPPPNKPAKAPPPRSGPIAIDRPPTDLPLPHSDQVPVDQRPAFEPGQATGGERAATSRLPEPPLAEPKRLDPRLLTPASELKPPYPASKVLSGQEATLRLRLTISESGRVTAVDSVGTADREFFDAARRYLIAHWRYQPATVDGRAITSSTMITLRFQLDS